MFQTVPLPRKPARTIEPTPYKRRETKKILAVMDTETHRFEYDLIVKPFTVGFYDGSEYIDFWGDDCITQFFDYLDANYQGVELMIYVHNGGNFDFYFCLDEIDPNSKPFIKNGRLSQLTMRGQEFRDSYDAIPVPLGTYQKSTDLLEPISGYNQFTDWPVSRLSDRQVVKCWELYRDIIGPYQRDDCIFLHQLITEFHAMFGDKLTMASVALPMLKSYHGFESVSEKVDEEIRPFYFGGRNQCFEVGELEGDWKIYDVNSMYPFVMASCKHPVSSTPQYGKTINDRTHFAFINATSRGALPIRKDDGGLEFPNKRGDYYATIHEIRAGIETGLLTIHKVHFTIWFEVETTFDEFINDFYSMRMEAKANGDAIRTLFYKLVMNSSYGKLAQDPRKYENYIFDPDTIPTPLKCNLCGDNEDDYCLSCKSGDTNPNGWYLHTSRDGINTYAQSSYKGGHGFFNVATAASITGAARALLLRGLAKAQRPIYADTDSIICEALDANLDENELGGWKLEASGDVCSIGGKKLYAVWDKGEPIKKASKGVKLTADQIARVCRGETVEYRHPVPKFQFDGSAKFTKRNIQRTGVVI